jgi:bacterioferritin-associated ferredoxin
VFADLARRHEALDAGEFERHFQYHQRMIVCLCHAVTEADLERVIAEVEEVGRRCGAGTDCGTCLGELRERLGGDADPAATRCASAGGCGSALVSVRSRQAR